MDGEPTDHTLPLSSKPQVQATSPVPSSDSPIPNPITSRMSITTPIVRGIPNPAVWSMTPGLRRDNPTHTAITISQTPRPMSLGPSAGAGKKHSLPEIESMTAGNQEAAGLPGPGISHIPLGHHS